MPNACASESKLRSAASPPHKPDNGVGALHELRCQLCLGAANMKCALAKLPLRTQRPERIRRWAALLQYESLQLVRMWKQTFLLMANPEEKEPFA